ncbi:MAG: STAS domain-containing protein [Pseudomonadota bacterium]
MELSLSKPGGRVSVAIPGPRLGAAEVTGFKRALVEVLDTTSEDVIIDLKSVEFVDSSGLGAIVGCLRHIKHPRRLALANLSPPVARVFKLTRMDRVFQIEEES